MAAPRKPLHPPFTDFPVALWTISLVFDLFSLRYGNAFVRAAFFNLAAGLVLAVLAAASGLVDLGRARRTAAVRRTALAHAGLNVLATATFLVDFWLRRASIDAARTPMEALVLSAVGVALVTTAARLGGRLVFEAGVNVRPVIPLDSFRARATGAGEPIPLPPSERQGPPEQPRPH